MRKTKVTQQPAVEEIAWKELTKANRTLPVPFNLILTDSNDILCCEEVVRIMPGKRLVAFAKWGNKSVVAKLFYDRTGAARKAKEDANGIQALVERGIPTPAIIYQGTARNKRIQVLIFERIMNAQDLDTLWQNKPDIASFEKIMRAVTIELATQHVQGVMQNDLHFKNFLLTNKVIYTLDGGDIEQFDQPLPKKETIDNLGLFFSQLGVGAENLQQKLFKIYAQSRGWMVKKHELQSLEKSIASWTKKRWVSYREKIMRECTAFAELKGYGAQILYDREYESEELLALLQQPEAAFKSKNIKILKAGGSSTVIKIQIAGKPYVLKRYNIKSIGHRLRRCLRPTRAASAWQLSQYLRWIGIATAKPIAFVENRFLGLRGTSYFLMEYVQGDIASDYFTRNTPDQNYVMADRMVRVLENLAKLRITHGDLKITNILIENERPVLIDLDGMKTHRTKMGFEHAFQKELDRFMQNWQTQPTFAGLFSQLIQEMNRRRHS